MVKHSDCCSVVVTLEPLVGAETYVNGKLITEGVELKQGTTRTEQSSSDSSLRGAKKRCVN